VLGRYREVLAEPHVTRLLLSAMVARLPQGMSGLAILLLLTGANGYGKAGLATGVSIASAGLSNVLLARAVDRVGARRVVVPSATAYAVATAGLAALPRHPYGAAVAVCAVVGLVTPPITSVSRGMWPRLLGNDRAQVIYGLEATAQELVFIAGPALVAVIAGLAGPRWAVISSGGLGLVGALAYVTAPPLALPPVGGRAPRQRVLRGTGLLSYVLVGLCLITGFGMTEVATVDFVGGRKASAVAGVVLALWSAGSMAGGLRFGAASAAVTDRTLARTVLLAGAPLVLCALAPGTVGLAVILFVGGGAVAPALARLYTRIGAVAPAAATTEAFGWLAVGFLAGASLGSALGGVTVQALGARPAFACAGVAASLSVIALSARPVASRRARGQAADQDAS
jgi:predicted MFS family arabinose efflux permease